MYEYQKHHPSLLTIIILLILQCPNLTFSDVLSDLTRGGLVVYFRHSIATTCDDTSGRYLGYANETKDPGWWMSCFPNCSIDDCTDPTTDCIGAYCRQLNLAGITLAQEIGNSLQYAPISWEKIYAGEFCRTKRTAELLFPGRDVILAANITDWVYSNQYDRCDKTFEFLTELNPPLGTNIAIVGDGRMTSLPNPTSPEYEICNAVNNLHQIHFIVVDPASGEITYDDIFANIFYQFLPVNSQWIAWDSVEGIIMTIITMSFIILNLISICVLFHQRTASVITRASPLFLYLILVGSLISYVTVFLMIGEPTPTTCIAQLWCFFFGFGVSFGSLLAKNWRIWRLYYFTLHKDITLTDLDLLKYLSITWAVLLAILVVWSVIFPPMPIILTSSDMSVKVCSGNPIMFYVALGFLAVEALLGVVIAIKTRNIPAEFREAKWIGLGTYNLTVVCFFAVPVSFAIRVSFLTISFVVLTMAILWSMSGIWMFLLLPKFYLIYVKGEVEVTIRRRGSVTNNTPEIQTRRVDSQRSVSAVG